MTNYLMLFSCQNLWKTFLHGMADVWVFLNISIYFLFSNEDFIYLFLERGREGEREGEKHQYVLFLTHPPLGTWPTTQACALDWESN